MDPRLHCCFNKHLFDVQVHITFFCSCCHMIYLCMSWMLQMSVNLRISSLMSACMWWVLNFPFLQHSVNIFSSKWNKYKDNKFLLHLFVVLLFLSLTWVYFYAGDWCLRSSVYWPWLFWCALNFHCCGLCEQGIVRGKLDQLRRCFEVGLISITNLFLLFCLFSDLKFDTQLLF